MYFVSIVYMYVSGIFICHNVHVVYFAYVIMHRLSKFGCGFHTYSNRNIKRKTIIVQGFYQ